MKHCIVIGGGVIGMLTARALIKRGYPVSVLEKGPFGREASWAGGGILSPLYPWRYSDAVNRLVMASQALYPELVRTLKSTTGIDPERIQSGMIVLDVVDRQVARQWADWKSVALQQIDGTEAKELEPSLLAHPGHAVFLSGVAQVRNPRLLKAVQADLYASGAQLHPATEVTGIETSASRVVAVHTADGRRLEAETIVIANGAWSGRLLRQAGVNLEIHPVRGQMLLLQAKPGLVRKIILRRDHYLIPRSDGQIVVGSTVENVGFDKNTTDQAYDELRRFAIELVPELRHAPVVRHWAGLRPGCGNGIPCIGPHPEIRGLYINAGHFRNGIVMAPGSAELLAALINGEETPVDARAYSIVSAERLAVEC